jgi:DNA-binding MarR family transcriptional regulator
MGAIADLLKDIPLAAVLREKVLNLESENASLQTEVASLKDDLRQAKAEVVKLKNEIDRLTHTDNLHETEIKILAYLADENTINFNDSMLLGLRLDQTRLDYFLERLRKQEYISYIGGSSVGEAVSYFLTQKGREYLIKNNLI